jgi:membrane-bound hydrogenase subunit alpha
MSKTIPVYQTSLGPTHPAFKEPIHLTFDITGEKVLKADFAPGQAHRGVEWMGMRRNPIQILYLAERICGICGITHALAFSRACEQIAGIEVPARAHWIRTICCELERIHSHLLWAGVAAHELGFDSLFYLTWKARERVLDLMEDITGNRIHYAIIQIGGVRRDLDADRIAAIKEACGFYEGIFGELAKCLLDDSSIKLRCRDVGVLTAAEALSLSAVGPTARASGVPSDVRADHPYAAYTEIPVEPILPTVHGEGIHGDVYDRIIVRAYEIKQSVDIVRACLDNLPPGPVLAQPKIPVLLGQLKRAQGEAVGMHEAPRGEVAHYVRLAGAEAPAAWKVKASSYSNYLSWVPMLEGEQVADIPIIAASIDPCISCTDRVSWVAPDGGGGVLTKEELTRRSVEKTRRIQARLAARKEA